MIIFLKNLKTNYIYIYYIKMTENISAYSTKEEIANYFEKNFHICEKAKNNIIKEDISGDILLDISDKEFKSLGIKLGQCKKVQRLLNIEKEKFILKEDIKEKITIKSATQEVKNFLKKYLNYDETSNTLDGKKLIQLNEYEMNNLRLNLGQKKKLIRYIKYFKTLPIEEEKNTSKEELNSNNVIKINNFGNNNYEEIKELKEKLNKANKIIEKQKIEIEELKQQINKFNNIDINCINNLKNEIIKKNNEINLLKQQLQNINLYNNNSLGDRCVNFISTDQSVFYAVPCMGNTIFAEVEEKLYKEYPEYRETNNTFLVNGTEILRFKTINDNKISSGKPVILVKPS